MYYSYKCPYCGRLFYTYNSNKEQASHTLYLAIKQHLIDYNEDHKEHEFDEGEQIESDQIYGAMSESTTIPPGGYEAIAPPGGVGTSTPSPSSTPSSPTTSTSSSSGVLLIMFLLLVIAIIITLFVFFPDVVTTIQGFFP